MKELQTRTAQLKPLSLPRIRMLSEQASSLPMSSKDKKCAPVYLSVFLSLSVCLCLGFCLSLSVFLIVLIRPQESAAKAFGGVRLMIKR